jgi:type I restriction enzyme S subunit
VEEAQRLSGQTLEELPLLVDAFLHECFEKLSKAHTPTTLDQLLVDASYGTSEKSYPDRPQNSVPVLRIPNVASEKLRLDDMKYAQLSPQAVQSLTLEDGDILIVRTNGSVDLVGRSAVVNALPEFSVFASYLIRLRFDTSRVTPEFAQVGLRHLRRSGALVDLARTTAGQYNVSLGRLRGASLPIPPSATQLRVVSELSALQAKVDAVTALRVETATELDAMLPAILDKAFKAEL